MELWNDYEGKTVAGRFPLERLISPEGRSAFFATRDAAGDPAILRVIESHFDEAEILARWKRVTDLQQEHLVGIELSGQAEIDGTQVVYALMENTDADLSAILRDRPLSGEETKQVGGSVIAALQALHSAGLVHEHIEPANVFAKGEVVKLRSDCVRDAPEGREGDEVRARDVQAVATLLLQALTQRRQLGAVGSTPLPYPFEEAVRNGISGAWSLKDMARALVPPPSARTTPVPPATRGLSPSTPLTAPATAPKAPNPLPPGIVPVSASPSTSPSTSPSNGSSPTNLGSRPAAGGRSASLRSPAPGPPAPNIPSPNTPFQVASISAAAASSAMPASADPTANGGIPNYTRGERPAPNPPGRIVMEPTEARPNRLPLLAGGAAAAVLLAGLGWHFTHTGTTPGTTTIQTAPSTTTSTATPTDPTPRSTPAPPVPQRRLEKPSAAVDHRYGKPTIASSSGSHNSTQARSTPSSGRGNWRVIAYTYNRQDQAQHKVDEIAARHAGLRPAVFSPSGRGPWLVTLGGEMSADQANALRNRARSEGMPRDTFARNYR